MYALIKFEDLWTRRISHIQIKGEGRVTVILNDDLVGHKHQRFIVELAPHKTVMVLNNIDMFPRLEPLDVGHHVEFFGEYIWNRHGGIVHWTHFDPTGKHDDGYINIMTESRQYSGDGAAASDSGDGDRADDRRTTDRRITDRRTGDRRSEDRRTGDRRVGDRRVGDRRSGDRRDDDRRSGDRRNYDSLSDGKHIGDRRAADRRGVEGSSDFAATDIPATSAATAVSAAATAVSAAATAAPASAQGRKHTVTPGIYAHFKGDKYEVMGIARHSETRENMVIYKSLRDAEKTWVRPLSMWNDSIYDGDKVVPRFKRVADVPDTL